jgi:hypothetical protein
MYLLLIWVVATILAIIIAVKIDEEDSITAIAFISIISYGVVIGIGRLAYSEDNNLDITEYKQVLIVSLTQDEKANLQGNFILGCGSVNGSVDDYYITYGRYAAGLKRMKLDAYNTFISKSDSEAPKIKNYYKRIYKKAFKSKWFWNREESVGDWEKNYGELYLVVPTNTIKIEGKFNIDH